MQKLPEATIERDGLLVTVSRDGRWWLDCNIDTYKGINCDEARQEGYPAGCFFCNYGASVSDVLRVPFGVTAKDVEQICSGRYSRKSRFSNFIEVRLPKLRDSDCPVSGLFYHVRDGIKRSITEYLGTEIPRWADALTESEFSLLLEMIERNRKRKGT